MKKKIIGAVMAITLLISLIPSGTVLADDNTNRNYFYGKDYSGFVDNLLEAIDNETVDVTDDKYGLLKDNYYDVFLYLLHLYPESFVTKGFIRYYYYATGGTKSYNIDYDEASLAKKEDFIRRQQEIMDEIKSLIPEGADDLAKAHVVHDYLCSTVAYDFDSLKLNSSDCWSIYTALGVYVDHYAVCQGYAIAYNYIMNELGVPCVVASSAKANHDWNIVKIGDEWYHVDTSADDIMRDMLGRVDHSYFLLSTETLLEKAQDRSDFVIYTKGPNLVFSDATCAKDKTYESGQYWTGSYTCCHYYKGDIYTVKGDSILCKNGAEFYKSDYATSWTYSGNKTDSTMNRLAARGNTVYLTTPKTVSCINLDTGEGTDNDLGLFYNESIYGLAWMEGKLKITISTLPPSAKEVWLDYDTCSVKSSGTIGSILSDDYVRWRFDTGGRIKLYWESLPTDHAVYIAYYESDGKFISSDIASDLSGYYQTPDGMSSFGLFIDDGDYAPVCKSTGYSCDK